MNTTTILTQIQRELERVQQLQADDPACDWKAYSACKAVLLTVAPTLPPDVSMAVVGLVSAVDAAYETKTPGQEDSLFLEPDPTLE